MAQTDAFLARLPSTGGTVLVQYSAYGFDRFGYPRWLLNALLEWKKQARGKLVIMFHEIWTFWPLLNKNRLLQEFHRRKLLVLSSVADAALAIPEARLPISQLSFSQYSGVLPVGSNIAVIETANPVRQDGLAVLFGLEKCQSSHVTHDARTFLKRLAAAGKDIGDHYRWRWEASLGGSDEKMLPECLAPRNGFQQRGHPPEEEVSTLLAKASFALSVQDELSLCKSWHLHGHAVHGLNTFLPMRTIRSEPHHLLADLARQLRAVC